VGWATPPSWLCVMEGEREDVVRKEGRERGEGEKKRKKKEKKPKRGGGEKGIQSIPGRRRKKIRRVEEEEAAPESRVATHGSSEEGEAGKEKHPKLSTLSLFWFFGGAKKREGVPCWVGGARALSHLAGEPLGELLGEAREREGEAMFLTRCRSPRGAVTLRGGRGALPPAAADADAPGTPSRLFPTPISASIASSSSSAAGASLVVLLVGGGGAVTSPSPPSSLSAPSGLSIILPGG
jgi:hypothetical protein